MAGSCRGGLICSVIEHLMNMIIPQENQVGLKLKETDSGLKRGGTGGIEITTLPYPGFATDMQLSLWPCWRLYKRNFYYY